MEAEKSSTGEATLLKGKGMASPPPTSKQPRGGWKKGASILDFVLRLLGISAGLAAAALMGTAEQILPFFTQFFQFHVQFNDVLTFMFFVFAVGIPSGYLILSLPLSIVCIVRPYATRARLLLFILDTVSLLMTIAGASAAAGIVYLAHNGNTNANWNAICQQFNDFCQQASTAVVNAFVTAAVFIFLIVLSAFALI